MKKIILGVFIALMVAAGLFLFLHRNTTNTDANTVVMKDSTGTEVKVPKHPQRVIFLNTSNMEIFVSVGGKPIGKATSNNVLPDVKEKIKDVTDIGQIYAPNLEKMLSLKPDLVVGTSVPFNIALRKPLQVANVPVYINVINSYEDVLRSIDLMGKFAGQEKAAAAKRAEIEQGYAALTQGVKPGSGKKVLILFGNTESFSMATSKSFTGDLVKRLGGVNVADSAGKTKDSNYIPLSMEYVTKNDPEVVLIITMAKGDLAEASKKVREDMLKNPQWQEINAVKNRKVYTLSGALFTVNPGTHIIEAMKIMQRHLNGED